VHAHFTPLEIFVEPQVNTRSENGSIMIETLNEPVTDANDMERDMEIFFPENDIQSEDELINYVLQLVTSCEDSPTYEDAMRSLLLLSCWHH
jgi:hypothetical protein